MRKFKITPNSLYAALHSHLYYLRDDIADGVSNESEMVELEKFDAIAKFLENLFDYVERDEYEVELGSDYTREIRDNLNLPEPESPEKILHETKNMIQVAIANAKSLQDLKQVLEIYENKIE